MLNFVNCFRDLIWKFVKLHCCAMISNRYEDEDDDLALENFKRLFASNLAEFKQLVFTSSSRVHNDLEFALKKGFEVGVALRMQRRRMHFSCVGSGCMTPGIDRNSNFTEAEPKLAKGFGIGFGENLPKPKSKHFPKNGKKSIVRSSIFQNFFAFLQLKDLEMTLSSSTKARLYEIEKNFRKLLKFSKILVKI